MKTLIRLLTVVAFVTALTYANAWSAEVVGTVRGPDHKPVQGVKILVVNPAKKVVASAISGTDGNYKITGLAPGVYTFKLDPMSTGFKAGDNIAVLTDQGLNVSWNVSPTVVALDDATPLGASGAGGAGAGGAGIGGATVGGISMGTLGIAGASLGVATGIGLGVAAGTGAIGGGGGRPVSPAL